VEAAVACSLGGQFSAQYFELGSPLSLAGSSRVALGCGQLDRGRQSPDLVLGGGLRLAGLVLGSRKCLGCLCPRGNHSLLSRPLGCKHGLPTLPLGCGDVLLALVLGRGYCLLLLAGGGGEGFAGQLFGGCECLAGLVLDGCGAFCFSGQLYFGGLARGDRVLSLLPGGAESFGGFQCLARCCIRPLDGLGAFFGGTLSGGHTLPGPVLCSVSGFLGGDPGPLRLGDLRVGGLDSSNGSCLNLIQPRRHRIECSRQCVDRSADRVQVLTEPLGIKPEGAAPSIQPERSQRLPLSPSHLRTGPPARPPRIPAETPRSPTLHPRPRQLRPALAVPASSSVLTHARERRS
jgi:hypothetical protein